MGAAAYVPDAPPTRPVCPALSEPPGAPGLCSWTLGGPADGPFGRTHWGPVFPAQASLRFWPFIHLLTFSPLIPIELKLLWVDAVEVVWIAILSRVNAREDDEPEPTVSAAE